MRLILLVGALLAFAAAVPAPEPNAEPEPWYGYGYGGYGYGGYYRPYGYGYWGRKRRSAEPNAVAEPLANAEPEPAAAAEPYYGYGSSLIRNSHNLLRSDLHLPTRRYMWIYR